MITAKTTYHSNITGGVYETESDAILAESNYVADVVSKYNRDTGNQWYCRSAVSDLNLREALQKDMLKMIHMIVCYKNIIPCELSEYFYGYVHANRFDTCLKDFETFLMNLEITHVIKLREEEYRFPSAVNTFCKALSTVDHIVGNLITEDWMLREAGGLIVVIRPNCQNLSTNEYIIMKNVDKLLQLFEARVKDMINYWGKDEPTEEDSSSESE